MRSFLHVLLGLLTIFAFILAGQDSPAREPSASMPQANAEEAWIKGDDFAAGGKYADALLWYKAAAQKGNMRAASEIGFLYQHGLGVPVDDAMAVHWYSMAANARDVTAMHRLAFLLLRGWGAPKDTRRSIELLNQAYALGNSGSAFALADLNQRGAPGFAPTPTLARPWFEKGFHEIEKAQPLCGNPAVQQLMARSMEATSRRAASSASSTMVFSLIGGLKSPDASPDSKELIRKVAAVRPILRHGDSEAECEVTFTENPTDWTFRVYQLSGGRYLVRPATGAQWAQLQTLRSMMAANGVRMPIGIENLYDTDGH